MKSPNGMQVAKALIFVAPIVVFVALAAQYLAWNGNLTIAYDFSHEPSFVSEWYPSDRVTDRLTNERTHHSFQEIHGEPVYVDVEVPRAFDTVDMTVEYRNPEHPIVNAGIVSNKFPWTIDVHPLQNTIIDDALEAWKDPVVDNDNGVTLLQAPDAKRYDSLETFLSDVPDDVTVGTYFYDRTYDRLQAQYSAKPGTLDIATALLGRHEFATYIKDEALHAEFSFVDMNATEGEDPILLEVFDGDVLIHEELLEDDGIATENAPSSDERTLTVHLEGLPEGVYRYNVVIGDDVAITHITTEQHQFVARNQVHAITAEHYTERIPGMKVQPTQLFTKSTFVDALAPEHAALQTVTVNGEAVELTRSGEREHWTRDQQDGFVNITAPKSDVEMLTRGYFAFTKKSYFDPDGPLRSMIVEDTLEDFDYILYEQYTPPQINQNVVTQTIAMDIRPFPIDRKDITFVFEAPYIGELSNAINIESAVFDFHRESFASRLKKRLTGDL